MLSPRQGVTLTGTTKACFCGVSGVVWCRKPRPRLVNRPFAPTLSRPVGHKEIRLAAPSRKVSDDGGLIDRHGVAYI